MWNYQHKDRQIKNKQKQLTDQKIQQEKCNYNLPVSEKNEMAKFRKVDWTFSQDLKHSFLNLDNKYFCRCKTSDDIKKFIIIKPIFTSQLLSQEIVLRIVKCSSYGNYLALGICNVQAAKKQSYRLDIEKMKEYYLVNSNNQRVCWNYNQQKNVCLNMKDDCKIRISLIASASSRLLEFKNGQQTATIQIDPKLNLTKYAFCAVMKGQGTSITICQNN